jgi:hypothetical protein
MSMIDIMGAADFRPFPPPSPVNGRAKHFLDHDLLNDLKYIGYSGAPTSPLMTHATFRAPRPSSAPAIGRGRSLGAKPLFAVPVDGVVLDGTPFVIVFTALFAGDAAADRLVRQLHQFGFDVP